MQMRRVGQWKESLGGAVTGCWCSRGLTAVCVYAVWGNHQQIPSGTNRGRPVKGMQPDLPSWERRVKGHLMAQYADLGVRGLELEA